MFRVAIGCCVLLLTACDSMPQQSQSLTQAAYGPDSLDTLEYRGEEIRLPRRYEDFEVYKDDPDNLRIEDIPRIAKLVKEAPLPSSFQTREQAAEFLMGLMFPGYGFSMLQLDKPLALFSIELPRMDEDRWVTLAPIGGKWVVVDDFIFSSRDDYLNSVEYANGQYRYRNHQGKVLRLK